MRLFLFNYFPYLLRVFYPLCLRSATIPAPSPTTKKKMIGIAGGKPVKPPPVVCAGAKVGWTTAGAGVKVGSRVGVTDAGAPPPTASPVGGGGTVGVGGSCTTLRSLTLPARIAIKGA